MSASADIVMDETATESEKIKFQKEHEASIEKLLLKSQFSQSTEISWTEHGRTKESYPAIIQEVIDSLTLAINKNHNGVISKVIEHIDFHIDEDIFSIQMLCYLQFITYHFPEKSVALVDKLIKDFVKFLKFIDSVNLEFRSQNPFKNTLLSAENLVKNLINDLLNQKLVFFDTVTSLVKLVKVLEYYPENILHLTNSLEMIVNKHSEKMDIIIDNISKIDNKELNEKLTIISMKFINDETQDSENRKAILDLLFKKNPLVHGAYRKFMYINWFKAAETLQERIKCIQHLLKEKTEFESMKAGYDMLAELLKVASHGWKVIKADDYTSVSNEKHDQIMEYLFKNANVPFKIQLEIFCQDANKTILSLANSVSSSFRFDFYKFAICQESLSFDERRAILFDLILIRNKKEISKDLKPIVSKLDDSDFKKYATHLGLVFDDSLSFGKRLENVIFLSANSGEYYLKIVDIFKLKYYGLENEDHYLVGAAFAFFNTQDVLVPDLNKTQDKKPWVEQHYLNKNLAANDLPVTQNTYGFRQEGKCSKFYKIIATMEEHIYKPKLELVEKGLVTYLQLQSPQPAKQNMLLAFKKDLKEKKEKTTLQSFAQKNKTSKRKKKVQTKPYGN